MKIADIVLDPKLQQRDQRNQAVIDEYAESIKDGAVFPPVTIYNDGTSNFLADGWKRIYAHQALGLDEIEANVIKGSWRDALRASARANKDHGERRNYQTIHNCVMVYLDDFEWAEWSDREIARDSGISHQTVGRIRKSLGIRKDTVKSKRNDKEVEVSVAINRNKDEELHVHDEFEEIKNALSDIAEENEALTLRLAVAAMEATDEEKGMAQDQLMEMSAKIKTLEATNAALKATSDGYMNKVAELMDQVKYWKRRAEKAEKAVA